MPHPQSTRTAARTGVVAVWLVALAIVGEPAWLAVLLGGVLVLVWASPYLLLTNRRPRGWPVRRVAPPGGGAGAGRVVWPRRG